MAPVVKVLDHIGVPDDHTGDAEELNQHPLRRDGIGYQHIDVTTAAKIGFDIVVPQNDALRQGREKPV